MAGKFIISLGFEMFWGVSSSKTVSQYGRNVLGEWDVIPKILKLFKQYDIRSTWATVGMLMCRNYDEWRQISPTSMPTYSMKSLSNYSLNDLVKNNEKLFFGRSLVEEILTFDGQEIGSHTYSHFYCGDSGVNVTQFSADLMCAKEIAAEMGLQFKSFVFPRNQVSEYAIPELKKHGFSVYRGNPKSWVYANTFNNYLNDFKRAVKLFDAYIPILGSQANLVQFNKILNCPSSIFLRPWSLNLDKIKYLQIERIKFGMRSAAVNGENFHLWWHPHNFGVNPDKNLDTLKELLCYFKKLNHEYGMKSICMGDLGEV